jgi:hypothetical protein
VIEGWHGIVAHVGAQDSGAEARLADVEGGSGQTLYRLHRASIKADLSTGRILERLDIEDVSEQEIDDAVDTE